MVECPNCGEWVEPLYDPMYEGICPNCWLDILNYEIMKLKEGNEINGNYNNQ